MSNVLKVKFKIGEIEFEAEGLPEDVSNERNTFMNTLLPAAVEAMIRTRGNAIQQDGHQPLAKGVFVDVKGGQRGRGQFGIRNVIEAYDFHILRHMDLQTFQGSQHTEGDGVIGGYKAIRKCR